MSGELYRLTQQILHRFDLHHMPPMHLEDGRGNGVIQHWCRWCGLRSQDLAVFEPFETYIPGEPEMPE